MNETENPTPISTTPTCQHCGETVEFSITEHGYRGFVHVATGLTTCPETTTR